MASFASTIRTSGVERIYSTTSQTLEAISMAASTYPVMVMVRLSSRMSSRPLARQKTMGKSIGLPIRFFSRADSFSV